MHMDIPWMAWIKCAMDTLGTQPKQLNIHNEFGSSFRFFLIVISNAQMTIMITSITIGGFATTTSGLDQLSSFLVGSVAPDKSRLECKICRSTPVCIALCYVCILYIHSITPRIWTNSILLASSNCCNFVAGSKYFLHNKTGTMDSIMHSKIIHVSSTCMVASSLGNPKLGGWTLHWKPI